MQKDMCLFRLILNQAYVGINVYIYSGYFEAFLKCIENITQ